MQAPAFDVGANSPRPSPPPERYTRHPVRGIHFEDFCLFLVHECGNAAGISALAINATTHQRGWNIVMIQSDRVSELMSNDDGGGSPIMRYDNQRAVARRRREMSEQIGSTTQ